MKMIEVTVIKSHPYGHEVRKPGQIRTVQLEHAPILKALGLIRLDEPPVVKKPIEPASVPIQVETTESGQIETEEDKPKRRSYRRRDMQAEEE